jgi:predicted amidohydrolase
MEEAISEVKIAASQMPNLKENVDAALAYINQYSRIAELQKTSLLCFPECFLQGYLLNKNKAKSHGFDFRSADFKNLLCRLPSSGAMLVIGLIELEGKNIFNTAVVIQDQQLIGRYRKTHLLPGESIFTVGKDYPVFDVNGLKFGINICYDTNFPEAALAVQKQGAKLIVCPSNNMMGRIKAEKFKEIHNSVRSERCRETGLWLISSDVTGEEDQNISYGPTAVISPEGKIVEQVPLMQVGMITASISLK